MKISINWLMCIALGERIYNDKKLISDMINIYDTSDYLKDR